MTRTAVITGGSGGIGQICGAALRARGYDVVLTARKEAALAAAAATTGSRYVVGDCAEPDDVARIAAECRSVDLLVHSAGVLMGTFVRKERLEDFDAVLRANLRSAFVTVQGLLPLMPVGARIVLISSSAGSHSQKGRAAYSASKAGLNAFADALRAEVARDGIHVNVIAPAPVETPMLESVSFEMHALRAQDVADAVTFLDGLDPRVALPYMDLYALSEGPLAPAPTRPAAQQAAAR